METITEVYHTLAGDIATMGSYSFGETISSSLITFIGGVDGEPETRIAKSQSITCVCIDKRSYNLIGF